MYGGHLDATRCTGSNWTRLDVLGTFGRDLMYGGHVIVVRYSNYNFVATQCTKKFGCAGTF